MGWLINLFWPIETQLDVGCLGRLGRVIHWASFVLAAGFVWVPLAEHRDYGFIIGAACVVIAGRAVRYILAQE